MSKQYPCNHERGEDIHGDCYECGKSLLEKDLPLILNLKERYPFECECGFKAEAGPSIFMSCFQQNLGSISCPQCKKFHRSEIDEKNEKFILTDYGAPDTQGPLPDACYRVATPEEIIKINEKKCKTN